MPDGKSRVRPTPRLFRTPISGFHPRLLLYQQRLEDRFAVWMRQLLLPILKPFGSNLFQSEVDKSIEPILKNPFHANFVFYSGFPEKTQSQSRPQFSLFLTGKNYAFCAQIKKSNSDHASKKSI